MIPRILLTFANEDVGGIAYLRALRLEVRALRQALEGAQRAGLCRLDIRTNVTVDEVVALLQEGKDARDIAVFHYAGHASGDGIFLESAAGPEQAHAVGLAHLLAKQPNLQLVFLNGCSTRDQVDRLLGLGVPAVVATTREIDDGVATRFAQAFYTGMARGRAMADCFGDAEDAVFTRDGDGASLYRTHTTRSLVPQPLAATLDLPWQLRVAQGAEDVRGWSLPEAAGDPLFGLPALPQGDLPAAPFRYLTPYGAAHCRVYFGRGKTIRATYDALTVEGRAPVVLLYGPSGTGKSSLLAAGVVPRLENARETDGARRYEVLTVRRTSSESLPTMLRDALEVEGEEDLGVAWRRREEATGRALILVLDQVEEAITRPIEGEDDELGTLFRLLGEALRAAESRPAGRALVALRSDHMATVLGRMEDHRLPVARVELRHLGPAEIEEIVRGPARTDALRAMYRLKIEPALPALIAHDLLANSDAVVAPTLAVLLSNMWQEAIRLAPDAPAFTVDGYRGLKRRGLLLKNFVDHQLASLERDTPEWMESGLVLDVLAYHTTQLGTSQVRSARALTARYAHRPDLGEVLGALEDHKLLTGSIVGGSGALEGEARLAHDTLGPIVRAEFEVSDRPGQRARRIVRERAREWDGGRTGPPLDRHDLRHVRAGLPGMAALRSDAERMVRRSQHALWTSRLRSVGLAALLLASLGALVWQQRSREAANAEAERVRTNTLRLDVTQRREDLDGRARQISEYAPQLEGAAGRRGEYDEPLDRAVDALEGIKGQIEGSTGQDALDRAQGTLDAVEILLDLADAWRERSQRRLHEDWLRKVSSLREPLSSRRRRLAQRQQASREGGPSADVDAPRAAASEPESAGWALVDDIVKVGASLDPPIRHGAFWLLADLEAHLAQREAALDAEQARLEEALREDDAELRAQVVKEIRAAIEQATEEVIRSQGALARMYPAQEALAQQVVGLDQRATSISVEQARTALDRATLEALRAAARDVVDTTNAVATRREWILARPAGVACVGVADCREGLACLAPRAGAEERICRLETDLPLIPAQARVIGAASSEVMKQNSAAYYDYEQRGELEAAQPRYEAAVRLDPSVLAPRWSLVRLAAKRGEPRRVLALLQEMKFAGCTACWDRLARARDVVADANGFPELAPFIEALGEGDAEAVESARRTVSEAEAIEFARLTTMAGLLRTWTDAWEATAPAGETARLSALLHEDFKDDRGRGKDAYVQGKEKYGRLARRITVEVDEIRESRERDDEVHLIYRQSYSRTAPSGRVTRASSWMQLVWQKGDDAVWRVIRRSQSKTRL